jgi:hypothetical protein
MNHISPLSAIFSSDVACPDGFQFRVFLRVLSICALPTVVSRSLWMYGHQERLFMAWLGKSGVTPCYIIDEVYNSLQRVAT